MLDAVYRDFGTGYVPHWHADIVDPASYYLSDPRHTLIVAVEERGDGTGTGSVAATAALDARGPAHPPNPPWVAERYPSGTTAQLRRVYVRPEHRRRGLATRLVGELMDFARRDGGYGAAYLHAHPRSPGAMELWRSLGKVVCDERDEVGGGADTVHVELPLA